MNMPEPIGQAWPNGPRVGHAFVRFQGAGPYAHLNLAGDTISVPAGARGTWTVGYRADAWPVQPGGSVTIWKWAPKFVFGMALHQDDPTRQDYCTARVEPAGSAARVELTDLTPRYKLHRQARLVIRDAPLGPDEAVCFVAGDTSGGAPPAAVLAFTAPNVALDVQVDHDGDGWPETQHRLWVHIVPDAATRLRAVAPSIVAEGEPFALEVRAEDANCNPGALFEGTVTVRSGTLTLATGTFPAADAERQGMVRLEGLRLAATGIHRLEVVAHLSGGGPALQTLSNPIRVMAQRPPLRVFWGELHSHTSWCDGMGSVEEGYRFARDVACLDFFSLSSHVMIGPGDDFPITNGHPVASSAAYWRQCQAAARQLHEPGRFVTFTGYEWSVGGAEKESGEGPGGSWGHHCVWFLADDHPMTITRTIRDQFAALARLAHEAQSRGQPPPAMIVPHSGNAAQWEQYGGRDLVAMPLVEVTSMHGHYEWFYQRSLEMGRAHGFKLGAVGMADNHTGHPGYDVWPRHGPSKATRERSYSVQGGLTAALAPELTREAIWDAFFDRRTYATSGERMLLNVWVENAATAGPADPRHARAHLPAGGKPAGDGCAGRLSMGQAGTAGERPHFRIQASGTAPLDLVEMIRDDRRVQRWVLPPDTWDVDLQWTDEQPLATEAAYYVRVTQTGDAFAWSSPIWLTCGATGAGSVTAAEAAATLPAWHEGVWPPEGDEAARASAAEHQPALEAFLAVQGAAGRYVDLRPVGMFVEHRGRYALFRGRLAKGGGPMQIRYYPDFAEPRVRLNPGWVDFGIGRKGSL